ncbi:MAG: hypothetical protein ACJAZK_001872 [Psychroserpens sp.]|jgi:hypothetical protein
MDGPEKHNNEIKFYQSFIIGGIYFYGISQLIHIMN